MVTKKLFNSREEFTEGRRMIVHVVSPTKVRLMSALDGERKREVLFETDAQASTLTSGTTRKAL